jgi:RNA polymerase sigma-70 factor (ECF subfamily)
VSASERLPARDSPAVDAEQLFQAYSAAVYRYCLKRLDSPDEAEDAVQVTYLNAWRSLRRGTQPTEPRAWLFGIAANVCATTLRTRLRGASIEVRDPEDFERLPSGGPPGEDLVDLDAALQALPTRQRQALVLRDWRGLSYDEIATKLDASQPAVETLLFRARRAVVASLATPARRIREVPVRSALSALPPWPWGLAGLKSSLTGSSATTKAALGIAAGATAPLIAFGVFGTVVMNEDSSRIAEDPGALGSRFDSARGAWRPVPPREDTPRPAIDAGKSEPAAATSSPSAPGHELVGATAGASVGHASGGGDTKPSAEPSPSPSLTNEPSAHVPAAANLVVICHVTRSEKNSAVTISVDAAAVEALLSHGDHLGACAG